LDDPVLVHRLYQKLDAATLATTEVVRARWKAKVGMFHVCRLVFIIDQQENLYLLDELRKVPGIHIHTNPTILVWTVNESLRKGDSSQVLRSHLESFIDDTPFRTLHIDNYTKFAIIREQSNGNTKKKKLPTRSTRAKKGRANNLKPKTPQNRKARQNGRLMDFNLN
jgi:hypothetical protein